MDNGEKKQKFLKEFDFTRNLQVKGEAVIDGRKIDILIPYSEIDKYFNYRKIDFLSQKTKFDKNDPVVRKVVKISLDNGGFSTSIIQTKLGKGHGFVSNLALWLEENEVIGAVNNHYPREMLISSMEEFDKKFE